MRALLELVSGYRRWLCDDMNQSRENSFFSAMRDGGHELAGTIAMSDVVVLVNERVCGHLVILDKPSPTR